MSGLMHSESLLNFFWSIKINPKLCLMSFLKLIGTMETEVAEMGVFMPSR